ncbi:hypothetical protein C8F01DRAFT_1374248 [Mycena amicta]|nr:hypothetical protein C8F01DRAFT_1374248 [Mycena amicta]
MGAGAGFDNQYAQLQDMKSTFALFASLAIVIASVSGVAVERRGDLPQATRLFNIYPTLAPEAAPVEQAKRATRLFNIYPTLAPEAAPVEQAKRATRLFNIYPTLAPEAAPVEQAKRGECPKSFASADSILLTMKKKIKLPGSLISTPPLRRKRRPWSRISALPVCSISTPPLPRRRRQPWMLVATEDSSLSAPRVLSI